MSNIITHEDLQLILQQSAAPQTCKIKIEVMDSAKTIIGTIYGIVSGTISINAESDIRRACNFTVHPTITEKIKITEKGLLWLNKDIKMSVGLYNIRSKTYKYYPMGYFVYTDTSGTYDKTTNQITINCSDHMKKLDGSKNGQIGALLTKFPAYKENEETGEVIKYNIIRDAVITILEQMCNIKNHQISDIGEHKAMPEYNADWEKYREETETWNAIPYDQEFSCGSSVFSILKTFRDLYANYEMFFEPEDNQFVCQLVPGGYEDNIFLDNEFIQRVLISESSSVDMTAVRNICEVWGEVIETDFYSEECSYSSNIYSCNIPSFADGYYNGDIVAIKIPTINSEAPKLNINGYGVIDICDENTDGALEKDRLTGNSVYAFKITKKRIDKVDVIKAYLLGQWQVHGINVLSSGKKSLETYTDENGKLYELYSKEYFQKKYNCESVEMTVIPNSPFTVQEIGEILDVKTGGEYENITSDSLALARAKWENWKNCRLTDNITITTALLLFLDVNKKVSYKPSDSEIERQYIIKSVSHDFTGYTSTIAMCRFYPLYEDSEREVGTNNILSEFSHESLTRYTHEQLPNIVSGVKL